jgi:hypothetical protein
LTEDLDRVTGLIEQSIDTVIKVNLLSGCGSKKTIPALKEVYEGYIKQCNKGTKSSGILGEIRQSHVQALALFEGDERIKNALLIFQHLGAAAVSEK